MAKYTQESHLFAAKSTMSTLSEHRFLELKATGNLPSPTGVALTMLENLQSKQLSSADLTSTIQADPALAGRLIKLANSLSDQQPNSRPTVSLADTISRVGVGVTKHITLGLSVISKNMDGQCKGFDYENFWSYSLAMGIATELLSEQEGLFPRDEAFTVGLLSNIGRLALGNVYPEQYTEILKQSDGQPVVTLLALEQEHFFTDHLEMSHAMLKDWGLPSVHYDAVHGIYDIDRLVSKNGRVNALAKYLNIASRLATLCIDGGSQDNPFYITLARSAKQFGIEKAELDILFDKTSSIWEDWSQMLEVPVCQSINDNHVQSINDDITSFDLEHTQDIGLDILIADDDTSLTSMLDSQLAKEGHKITIARTGKEALQIALETQPQLLISDMLMPEMDGLELCHTLRKTRQGQKMYIIILTAKTDEKHLIQAFKAGADDFIEKPVQPNIVLARIRGGQRVFQLIQAIKEERKENRRILDQLSSANKHLEQAALTDPLTHIPNRRYASHRLEQEWASSERDNTPLTCMLVDIDHFKNINDKYGHDAGDNVLYQVAQTLRSMARVGDEVCRFGGEEFLVICSNTDLASAEATAERLRVAIEALSLSFGDKHQKITISIGIASRSKQDTNTSQLLKAADVGVYLAKAQGRNRICTTLERKNTLPASHNADIKVAPQPAGVVELS